MSVRPREPGPAFDWVSSVTRFAQRVRHARGTVSEHLFAMPRPPRFTQIELRDAVSKSRSWAETLRRLGYRSAGGNWKTLKKYSALWDVDSSHFDPDAARNAALARGRFRRQPLAEILVRDSSFSRTHLDRLFEEGLKERRCEFCGQGEIWRGKRMSLILDHINGIPNDHRLENLRILCPNCAATLKTHCGRKNLRSRARMCDGCGEEFTAKYRTHRFCSRTCGQRFGRHAGERFRRVDRPPYQELIIEIDELGYAAVGRKYGVSDNAIRKWVRFYEKANERTCRDGAAE